MNELAVQLVIKEWIRGKKRLTPEEVRAKTPGSYVWIHQCYGKLGEHLFINAKVVQNGSKKQLAYRDYKGNLIHKDIKSDPKIAYTED